MSDGTFVIFTIHAMLLSFCVNLPENFIYNIVTFVWLFPAKCQESSCGVEEFEDVELVEVRGLVSRSSKLGDVKDLLALRTSSAYLEEKMKMVHNAYAICFGWAFWGPGGRGWDE